MLGIQVCFDQTQLITNLSTYQTKGITNYWSLQSRQLPAIVRVSRPTRADKARRLGYKAKQGYVIYRVRIRRGGRKRPVRKGKTMGKPKNEGINQLKFKRNHRSVAEERAGRRCGGLRVLNSYWINQVSNIQHSTIAIILYIQRSIIQSLNSSRENLVRSRSLSNLFIIPIPLDSSSCISHIEILSSLQNNLSISIDRFPSYRSSNNYCIIHLIPPLLSLKYHRTHHSSTTKLSWSIPLTTPSAEIPASTGSSSPPWSTENSGVWLLPVDTVEDWATATTSTNRSPLVVQAGREETLCRSEDTDKQRRQTTCSIIIILLIMM